MQTKPTFYMMVGVPGSGKTTYAHQIPNATVLSSDDIRAEIGADGGDKKMHKQVFDILHGCLRCNESAAYAPHRASE